MFCLTEKSWPILYSKLQYEMVQDFLDILYICSVLRVHYGQRPYIIEVMHDSKAYMTPVNIFTINLS